MYARFFKRPLDFFCALSGICVLSPLLIVLTVVGAVKMHGNQFFTQPRPGKDEKIFKLIKFRTMTNQRDSAGNLLPDDKRLSRPLGVNSVDRTPVSPRFRQHDSSIRVAYGSCAYGRFLRSSSLDRNQWAVRRSACAPRNVLQLGRATLHAERRDARIASSYARAA